MLFVLLSKTFPDKRRHNHHIPFEILLCLAVTAKLKIKTSLTDVPFAVNDAQLLAELGWNIWDNERCLNEGLFSESVLRNRLSKYSSEEWICFYNSFVQNCLMPKPDIRPNFYIFDCIKVPVDLQKYFKRTRVCFRDCRGNRICYTQAE